MKNIYQLAAVSAFCLWSINAHAAGYQLNEYSATGLGRSFAGAGIMGDDYSALAYNPAGMTLIKQSGAQAGLTVAQIHSKIHGQKHGQGDERKTGMNYGVPLPSLFTQFHINDSWTAGLGVYTPYGLKTRYSRNSYLAEDGVESLLEIIDIAPAVAYKPTKKLSLGASVIARYIHGKMTNTVNIPGAGAAYGTGFSEFDLDGWTAAWTAGLMYEFSDQTRFGISYKSKSMQTVKGDHTVSGFRDLSAYGLPNLNEVAMDGKASPDLPQSVLISAYHQPTEKWGFSASARWTDWEDSFQEFTLASSAKILATQPVPGQKTANESWKKSWTISLGADYYLNENWTLRAGTAWDQSPIRNADHRYARIPDSDRVWLSCGFSYRQDNYQIDAGYAHLFMKNSVAREPNGTTAHYKSYSNMFGLNFQYKF